MKIVITIDAQRRYDSPLAWDTMLLGFTSISTEPMDPKVYISMEGIDEKIRYNRKRRTHNNYLSMLMEVLDHETVHLMAFLYSEDKHAGWNEKWAKRFSSAGKWARANR